MALKILSYTIVLSLFFCVYFIYKKHLTLKNSDRFEGRVVGYESVRGTKGVTYALRVEYQDADYANHTFTASGATSPPAKPIGAKVVVFQPRDASDPNILVFESLYLGLWIWFCLGICVFGCVFAPYILNLVYLK